MRKRIFAASTAALVFSMPAIAQPYPPPRGIPAPREVEAMGHAVGRAAEAIMDVPIAGVVQAIDPTRPVHPDTRLGDVAGGGDPYARERMHRSIGAISAGMGAMATQMAVLAPVLQRSIIDLEARLEQAMRGFPGRDDYYDEPYDYGDYYDYDD